MEESVEPEAVPLSLFLCSFLKAFLGCFCVSPRIAGGFPLCLCFWWVFGCEGSKVLQDL